MDVIGSIKRLHSSGKISERDIRAWITKVEQADPEIIAAVLRGALRMSVHCGGVWLRGAGIRGIVLRFAG